MTITVKFFPSLRERVGKAEATLTAASSLSLTAVWQQTANIPMPDNTLSRYHVPVVASAIRGPPAEDAQRRGGT